MSKKGSKCAMILISQWPIKRCAHIAKLLCSHVTTQAEVCAIAVGYMSRLVCAHIQVPPQHDLTQSLLALVGGTGCLSRQPNTGEHALAIGSGGAGGSILLRRLDLGSVLGWS